MDLIGSFSFVCALDSDELIGSFVTTVRELSTGPGPQNEYDVSEQGIFRERFNVVFQLLEQFLSSAQVPHEGCHQ